MEHYLFVVMLGRVEVLREEILAVSDEPAVDVASAALDGLRAAWTIACLTDGSGRVVCKLANPIPARRPTNEDGKA